MKIIIGGATSLMNHAGVDRHYFWSDAILHRTALQNMIPIQGRMTTPYELQTGEKPNVLYLRVCRCEAVSYVERDHRYKYDDRAERYIYIGIFQLHDNHTFKLLNLRSFQTLYRRNVKFDENSLPCRMDRNIPRLSCYLKDDSDSG